MRSLRHLLATILGRSQMESGPGGRTPLPYPQPYRTSHPLRLLARARRSGRPASSSAPSKHTRRAAAKPAAWPGSMNCAATFATLCGPCARVPDSRLAAVLSLAAGIGVNTSAFTSVNALVLAPLPLSAPGPRDDCLDFRRETRLSAKGVWRPAISSIGSRTAVPSNIFRPIAVGTPL